MSFAKAYIGTALPFLVIDAAWIGLVVRGYYQDTIGYLLLDKPNLVAAGLFYLAYAAGIVILAVQPAVVSGKLKTALINGAVLGAMAYGRSPSLILPYYEAGQPDWSFRISSGEPS